MATRPPTLTEILLDVSPPPWTLSAFMAYLSQNHCMETLEFTLDSQRYAAFYDQLTTENPPSQESNARVCGWWDKLMEVYIVPCAPREVNIPARVRDCLLSLPSRPTPPHPAELEEAGRIVYELMNDSLLVPFLQSVAPIYPTVQNDDDSQYNHRRRSQNNSHRSDQPRRSVTSPHSADLDSLTDDSDSNAASGAEPMTPPTTPPTSEYTFNSSPGGFQRAMAAHNKGWKKVGEKLGFSRKASSRRSTPTSSSASDYDAALGEPSQSHS
ncbi:regulator of G-protein signaling [Pochonia chlamydosporia 170]|uniref:Regulator of G-protein signaling n=1 Tax=Pochonia chlamydosporia 170 TaxID=1380566 RepID=A0A179G1D3_METCM|nr:regulator of G-protein signaling [Pochonia chlamydosporia 170]OAQ71151.1 regulator of G-protein signaling [Pochonia chlamydosporia 170]